jgi:hypothetical protein
MRENTLIVASLLTRSRDHSPLLRYPSVYSCATRLGLARRKHRFVYCCIIVGACFDGGNSFTRMFPSIGCACKLLYIFLRCDNSVGITMGCGMDGHGSIAGKVKKLSLLHRAQTGSRTHPTSYAMGTGGGLFSMGKAAGE